MTLCRAWGAAEWRARLAGLMHDCARELSLKQLMAVITRRRRLSPFERDNATVLHGEVGTVLARQRYGLRDRTVLQAIADHVLGRPAMSGLSRQLYVADFIAADRVFPAARALRRQAFCLEPEELLRRVVETKLTYLRSRSLALHPDSEALARELGLEV